MTGRGQILRGITPTLRAWIIMLARLCLLVGLFNSLAPVTVQARVIEPRQACHAQAGPAQTDLSPANLTQANLTQAKLTQAKLTQAGRTALGEPGKRWTCGPGDWTIDGAGTDLLFGLSPDQVSGSPDNRPRSLVTQASRFEAITVWVFDADGAVRSARYRLIEAHYLAAGPLLSIPLPPLTARTTHVLVRIERPWSKVTASEAWLDSDPQGTGWTIRRVAMMAMICGLLIVPLLLNGAFYGVLRERYVLFHMVLTAGMLTQVVIGSGFLRLVTFVTPAFESPLSNACFAIAGSAGLLFAADFIEADRLDARLRRLLRLAAPVVTGVGLITAIPAEALRHSAALLVHLDMIPVMILVGLAAISGSRRGSVSALFLVAGWAPALLVGLWKVISYLLPTVQPLDGLVVFHLGLAAHVVITTFGIIYRMIGLRRELDDATARAIELEGVAGRDALTGLRNRHSIERRFHDLFRQGFRTMAVIDLDHFKAINDEHGHTVGDVVLKAAALALREDVDTRAIRLGGEEFLLLLRGLDSAERAERTRRAISARVAAQVPGLDRVVTASMGLVEHDMAGTLRIEFEALYAHCDRLLYEAKRLGRNRTMRERVTAFGTGQAAAANE